MFFDGTKSLGVVRPDQDEDITWPTLPLFCRWTVDAAKQRLVVTTADDQTLEDALEEQKVGCAILGGMDRVFDDPWIKRNPQLKESLCQILVRQLKMLHSRNVHVCVELSGLPKREYASLIGQLCPQGVIAALGINGEDELPTVAGPGTLELTDFGGQASWVPLELRQEASKLTPKDGVALKDGEHFEYITYLRAKRLAEATGVQTLYVHTTTLDFILMKGNRGAGALLAAQEGDMMGKGFVIAALFMRAHGKDWTKYLAEMTPAIKPEAMARLGRFAHHFAQFEKSAGARDQLIKRRIRGGEFS